MFFFAGAKWAFLFSVTQGLFSSQCTITYQKMLIIFKKYTQINLLIIITYVVNVSSEDV